jgi:hypothetical protein
MVPAFLATLNDCVDRLHDIGTNVRHSCMNVRAYSLCLCLSMCVGVRYKLIGQLYLLCRTHSISCRTKCKPMQTSRMCRSASSSRVVWLVWLLLMPYIRMSCSGVDSRVDDGDIDLAR